MLDESKAKKLGFKVKDAKSLLPNEKAKRLEQIKSLLPMLVNGDGLLDAKALQDFLGIENFATTRQGYGLNFAGKGMARIKADEPTERELKIELKQSKYFDNTKNMIIRGDNLDALKLLRQNYTRKVKMIYIAPPYNTGSDGFLYRDNFKESEADLIAKYGLNEHAINFFENVFETKTHSGWLFAMYPRLKLARDLLSDDGVIFISIDDNEQANLKIMCDEIFGEENFINNFMWLHGLGKKDKHSRTLQQYILCYGKDKKVIDAWTESVFKNYSLKNKDNDKRGGWFSRSISFGEDRSNKTHKNYFSITSPSGIKWTRQWQYTEDEIKNHLENNEIYFGVSPDYKDVPKLKIFPEKDDLIPRNIIDEVGETDSAIRDVNNIFQAKKDIFNNPKPNQLLEYLIKISTNKNSIILDFFAGSGTTAHAVLDLNKKDGGNRQFVLIQLDEAIDPKKSKPAYDFCQENKLKTVISSICIERVNRAGETIKQEAGLEGSLLDIGYKVFSLTDRPSLEVDGKQKLTLPISRATTQDTLYNMIAASGMALLTDKIEEIKKDKLYRVNNIYYLLGDYDADFKDAGMVFVDGYAKISLKKLLNIFGLDKEKVKILY